MPTEVQQILTAVRALSSKERQELAMALDREALVLPVQPNQDLVLAVRGKYAHVPTSSEAFIARKHEDLAGVSWDDSAIVPQISGRKGDGAPQCVYTEIVTVSAPSVSTNNNC